MKSSNIGGQAVLEGIMMKNGDRYAVAVRKENGQVEVMTEEYAGAVPWKRLTKIPFVRGVFNFIDSLVLGMKALSYSASFFEAEEEGKELSESEQKKQEKREELVMGITMACSVVLSVVIFMVLPYFLSNLLKDYVTGRFARTVIEGLVRIAIFIGYILLVSRMEDIQRVFMYHGAEHKCINCIERGMDLNVENVRGSSKEHKRCGTSFLFFVLMVSIVVCFFITTESPALRIVLRLALLPVIAGISYEIIRLAGNSDSRLVALMSRPGLALQGLTTKEPDDSMIEVAIQSVEAVFDWRAYQAETFGK